MKTDLDSLHYVIKHKRYFELIGAPRGIGRTFASCHNLAGILETCEEGATILWPLPYMHWLQHVKPMVIEVLTEHGLKFHWYQRHKLECGTKNVFFGVDREEFYIGNSNCYVVDTFGEVREEKEHLRNKILKREARKRMGIGEFRFEL